MDFNLFQINIVYVTFEHHYH